MKAIHSKALDSAEATVLSGAAAALLLHYLTGELRLPPEALSATWAAVILPAVMIAVRVIGRWVKSLPDDDPAGGEDGFARVALLALVAAMSLILMIGSAGCGSTYTVKAGGWKISANADGSQCLNAHGDGNPEIVRVCIANPEPLKIPRSTLTALCEVPR